MFGFQSFTSSISLLVISLGEIFQFLQSSVGFFKPDLKLLEVTTTEKAPPCKTCSTDVSCKDNSPADSFFPHLSCWPCIYQASWHMKACDQTRLWSLHGTPRLFFLSLPGAATENFHSLKFFLNCMDTPFSSTLILPAMCLCWEVFSSPVPAQPFLYKTDLFSILETQESAPALNRLLNTLASLCEASQEN